MTVAVDAVCYFRIIHPVSSVVAVENARLSSQQLAATTLRNILGRQTLHEILQGKEVLDDATEAWGIKIDRIEL